MSKRQLTTEEIESITNELKIIGPVHFKQSIHDNVIHKLKCQLEKIELYPDMYTKFKQQIIDQYYKSHISPGENVGILTAQSIGEKQTQMSLSYAEPVYVKKMGVNNVRIGKFIEDMFNKNYAHVIRIDENSWVLDISEHDYHVSSVDVSGNVKWSKITCLSKHAPGGDLVEIETLSERKVICTYSHSLLTMDEHKNVIPIRASDISIGTYVPILYNYDTLFRTNKTLVHNTAQILGICFKQAFTTDNKHELSFKPKTHKDYNLLHQYAECNKIEWYSPCLEIIVYKHPKHLINILSNNPSIPLYILSNGSKQDVFDFTQSICEKNTITYVHEQYLNDIELLLNVLGYTSYRINEQMCTIHLLPNIFKHKYKCTIQNDIRWDIIKSIKHIPQNIYKELYNYVYDFSVADNETFMTTNGLFVHNTLNSVIGSELIHYYDELGVNRISTIGYFIDTCLKNSQDDVQFIPENNTEYLELTRPMRILSVTSDGNVEWSNITAVTRHDIQSGDLVKVETKLGRVVTATKTKSFLTRCDNKLIQKTCGELKVGDAFPIVHKSPIIETINIHNWEGYDMDWDLGCVLGMYFVDGDADIDKVVIRNPSIILQSIVINFAYRHCHKYVEYYEGVYIYSNHLGYVLSNVDRHGILPSFLFSTNYECLKGFIYGLFNNFSVFKSESYELKLCIAELLNKFGLISSIEKMCIKILNFDDYMTIIILGGIVKDYNLNDNIPGVVMSGLSGVSSRHELKSMKLSSITDVQIRDKTIAQTVYYDTIKSITPIQETPKVYDLTVDNKTFALLGGSLVYDTFHTAGLTVKTVVTGVPRFMELMNTTKEPKSASCFIRVPVSDTLKCIYDIRNYIGDKIRCLQLTRILYDYDIVSYKDVKNDWWIRDEVIPVELVDDDRVLRLQMSHKLIYEYRCSLTQIVNKINNIFTDIYAVCASLNECIIDIFILNKQGIQLTEHQVCYVTEDNKYDVFLEEIVLAKLNKFVISGIEKINDFMITTVKQGQEWIISTEGSNLKGLMELDMFEFSNITSNNMWEIYNLLGVEATREFLIREFTDVISSDGTFINKCHIFLLVDSMTCKGDITSISRYSLRSKSSVLSRSSFEESIENFLKSGIFSEIDKMTSISSNIMTGKLSKVGTGIPEIIMDTSNFNTSVSNQQKTVYDLENVIDNTNGDSILNILTTIFEN